MKLSRLELRPGASHQPKVYEIFERPYRLHQEIWQLFADDPDRDRDFLYRLDQHRGRPRIYTLSSRRPADAQNLWRIQTKPFEPVLAPGDLLCFSVRINPTVKRDGKRHDVVMDAKTRLQEQDVPRSEWPPQAELVHEHCTAWLADRAERYGFELPGTIRAEGYEQHELRKHKHGRPIRITTCDFQGLLRVTEPETFLAHVERGLGPAKSFGCGLMLLARPRSGTD